MGFFSRARHRRRGLLVLLLVVPIVYALYQYGPQPRAPPKRGLAFAPVLAYTGDPFAAVNATLFSVVPSSALKGVLALVEQVKKRSHSDHRYPWVFAHHEPFSREFRDKVEEAWSGKVVFATIPKDMWSLPPGMSAARIKETVGNEAIAAAHHHRFWSGLFMDLPELTQYKYAWRVEPDIRFACDLPTDFFRKMRNYRHVYGWTMTTRESELSVGLWDVVRGFMKRYPQYIHPSALEEFVVQSVGEDKPVEYSQCLYWTDFEVLDMDLLRGTQFRTLFNHLDKSGGFYHNGWHDGPVRTMGMLLLVDRQFLIHFDNTGYVHGSRGGCPMQEDIRGFLNCECDPHKDWTWHPAACGERWYNLKGQMVPPDVGRWHG